LLLSTESRAIPKLVEHFCKVAEQWFVTSDIRSFQNQLKATFPYVRNEYMHNFRDVGVRKAMGTIARIGRFVLLVRSLHMCKKKAAAKRPLFGHPQKRQFSRAERLSQFRPLSLRRVQPRYTEGGAFFLLKSTSFDFLSPGSLPGSGTIAVRAGLSAQTPNSARHRGGYGVDDS
jgi:hypothetical protein